ncbi:MAG: hypothetical protein QT11_C0001G0847 [archaeon GW2011_AR20]|nr:MAG: hypothetical protein QT11_C0001G0847 [archaeon GW2011_AR20]MBS3160212.1 RDD family protein [Candidatus Woesearchaeota archaeon]
MKKETLNLLLRNPNEVSIWKRAFAFIIDLIIIQFIVNLTFYNYIEKNIGNNMGIIEMYQYLSINYEMFSGFLLTINIITAVILLIYLTLLEWRLNQSLGKMILNIKVIPKKITLWQALIRNLPKALFLINYVSWIFLIDLVYLAFTKQRFFDKLAGTSLVKVK